MRIKPQGEQVIVRVKLPAELHAQLEAYRALLGERTRMDYVISEALRSFLAGDKDFRRTVLAERQPARGLQGTRGPGRPPNGASA